MRDLPRSKVNYELQTHNIVSSSRLSSRPSTQVPGRRKIVVKLIYNEARRDIVQACKLARPADLYINDNLSKNRSRILYALRQAKRRKPELLGGCGSQNGRFFVWIKAPDASTKNRKAYLNSWDKLSDFCVRSLQLEADSLITDNETQ